MKCPYCNAPMEEELLDYIVEIDDQVLGLDRPDELHAPGGVGPGVPHETPRVVLLALPVERVRIEGEYRVDGAVVVQQVLSSKGANGYNVATGNYEDLVKAGVVDPTKVSRIALQNAASIAGLLLTTECIISDAPDKSPAPAMPQGGHGGGMDY